jgi:hypothetical protein
MLNLTKSASDSLQNPEKITQWLRISGEGNPVFGAAYAALTTIREFVSRKLGPQCFVAAPNVPTDFQSIQASAPLLLRPIDNPYDLDNVPIPDDLPCAGTLSAMVLSNKFLYTSENHVSVRKADSLTGYVVKWSPVHTIAHDVQTYRYRRESRTRQTSAGPSHRDVLSDQVHTGTRS